MRESWTNYEVWVYRCNRCTTTWREEYKARHVADGHGGEAVSYEHDGHQCTSPWCDHVCPKCQSQNVKASPTPWKQAANVPVQAAHYNEDLALVLRLRRLNAY
ncbi:hypothetical protein [Thermomonospora umbrina]|uniref:C2H2-type domain-containing protein n=1 Tax=Thermomonospora umbrina TaxID=111806 RepID=A0A3D9SP31_9ACTN|nr:hypothetical protein [Thermomonospora umbrina]REE96200.1 hypothetical protein DFJ69_1627 [Thermomonospora umbrina]